MGSSFLLDWIRRSDGGLDGLSYDGQPEQLERRLLAQPQQPNGSVRLSISAAAPPQRRTTPWRLAGRMAQESVPRLSAATRSKFSAVATTIRIKTTAERGLDRPNGAGGSARLDRLATHHVLRGARQSRERSHGMSTLSPLTLRHQEGSNPQERSSFSTISSFWVVTASQLVVSSSTYTLTNFLPSTCYLFFLVPFYRNIDGPQSNSQTQPWTQ
ncbi:hypothetical protein DAPPUDRAFT_267550 [Daphnia pulex]|uniref:Uncharacterized protein n=1 Tax=Daphnia pulex TaxID=6669 RepID=E9HWM9_DAPPU|nr:hypothetical protein DAPPUDRAFT_267550 [Daphnia pulex]|eukprot:EFX63850.1 hypothetical protein DAPPUDRAFT_267550 [Daphnia pulex]